MSPGVPLKRRPAIISNDYRRTLRKLLGPRAKDGEVLQLNSKSLPNSQTDTDQIPAGLQDPGLARVAGLRVDFVARPGSTGELACSVNELMAKAELYREGLLSSMLLVSDREARLVTLLTLWEPARFENGRERLTSWTKKLVSRLTDGPIRSYTGMAHFLNPKAVSGLTLDDLRPDELAEIVAIANAG